MALVDQIRNLRDDSLAALGAGWDYYQHTQIAWRALEDLVAQGHRFTARVSHTGTFTDQDAFVKLAQKYPRNYLTPSTFIQIVSLFEDFIFDFLRMWLMAYPGSLSERPLKFDVVLKSPDKEAITFAVIDAALNQLKYERVADWFQYLERLAKLGCPSDERITAIAEMKASRDIIMHNKSVVNAVYVAKSGLRARFRVGERMDIPRFYLRECWEVLQAVIREIADAAIAKL
jgi:hypothetical protein